MKRFARVAATLAIIAPLALHARPGRRATVGGGCDPGQPSRQDLRPRHGSRHSTASISTKIAAYIRKNEPHKNVDNQVSFGLTMRGFDLVSIEKNEPRHLEYVVKDHARGVLGYTAFSTSSTMARRSSRPGRDAAGRSCRALL